MKGWWKGRRRRGRRGRGGFRTAKVSDLVNRAEIPEEASRCRQKGIDKVS